MNGKKQLAGPMIGPFRSKHFSQPSENEQQMCQKGIIIKTEKSVHN